MEISLGGIFVLLGTICAFFESVISSIAQDDIQSLKQTNPKRCEELQRIKSGFTDELNSFLILEVFFYSASAIFLGFFSGSRGDILMPLWLLPLFLAVVLFFRYFFYGLGRRASFSFKSSLVPVLKMAALATRPLLRLNRSILNRIGGKSEEEASRFEISALVESAREEGSLDADEYRILKNIMHFSEVLASDVMTPRTVVFACEADLTVAEVIAMPELRMYSRFPIFEGESLDSGVIGYCITKDILLEALRGRTATKLRALSREVYFIPENAGLDSALDMFLNRRQHLFIVVDEYGGVDGLLTMEDVLETMLGAEIVDEADRVVDLRLLAKQLRDKRVASIPPPVE